MSDTGQIEWQCPCCKAKGTREATDLRKLGGVSAGSLGFACNCGHWLDFSSIRDKNAGYDKTRSHRYPDGIEYNHGDSPDHWFPYTCRRCGKKFTI